MQEQRTLVDDCERRSSKLSNWELNFIDSIGRQLDEGKSLSDKQQEVLDRIWEKATAR